MYIWTDTNIVWCDVTADNRQGRQQWNTMVNMIYSRAALMAFWASSPRSSCDFTCPSTHVTQHYQQQSYTAKYQRSGYGTVRQDGSTILRLWNCQGAGEDKNISFFYITVQ